MRFKSRTMIAIILTLAAAGLAFGQQAQSLAPDPIEQLQLTPDQRQAIRQIVEQNKDERQTTNRRVREANIALDKALDAEPTDENLIEQRINELVTAQGAQMRLRIHTELRIRRVLRPEQITTLRRLRLQMRDVMAPPRMDNPRRSQQGFRPRP